MFEEGRPLPPLAVAALGVDRQIATLGQRIAPQLATDGRGRPAELPRDRPPPGASAVDDLAGAAPQCCYAQRRYGLSGHRLNKRLPPHRVGTTEQLLGLLPAQVQTMQRGADGLPAAGRAELFAHPADQALEGPAVHRVGASYGRGG